MDPIETMVNQHHDDRRDAAKNKRDAAWTRHLSYHCNRINIAITFVAACLFFTLIGLVHPGLGIPLMILALMYGCYHLGRCVRVRKRTR